MIRFLMLFSLVLGMTFMGALASVFLKKASGSEDFFKMLCNVNLYLGGGLYLAASVLNIIVLRYLEYSVVLPLSSITYIWTMVLSYLLLKETITGRKAAGVLCIIAGAACVAL
ncbi:MAG: EamA family transporter [Eubacterium sp.]|nr:EamA family transporter [Eubacterium sp.]